ncbi:MAG: hypothetical protein KDA37_10820, partial [Planctomycetales bacterium]|nr:hypothetical protein [Planctomycetales bacterium]
IGGCSRVEEAKLPPAPPSPDRPPTAEAAEPAAEPEVAAPNVASYMPPYPQRTDLFTPPKRVKQAARHTSGDSDDAVELMGFVTVDEPRAVLSIDGVIAALPAGGQKYGIEVISVEPPRVILQRGRNRWTASLQ